MRPILLSIASAALFVATACFAQQSTTPASGPYHVLRQAKVGGEGGFDYVYADSAGRKLYVARGGQTARVSVFNLDTLEPAGEIPNTAARGAAADASTHHGFASSKPVAMWDTNTLAVIKTIPVEGGPDGILNDTFNHRTWVFSHRAPNATVINDSDGTIAGTVDLGGAPEQAVTDGRGRIWVDLEDKDQVAAVDAASMQVTAKYSLNGKGGGPGGLALDARHHVLYVACHDPATMVMLDSRDGHYLADVPIGRGVDGATFNPRTGEAFSSQGDGTLTVIRQTGPAAFTVVQNVQTLPGAKTLTLDERTGHVLLITAEWGPATQATAPGGRARRGPLVPGSFSILVVGK